MQFIGFDVHKQSFSAAIIDPASGSMRQMRGPVTRDALLDCLNFPGLKKAVFEAGRTDKQGNRWLRWAMIEAVSPAVTKDVALRMRHMKMKRRKGTHAARMNTARRLLTIAYHVLNEQRAYYNKSERVAFSVP